LPFTGRSRTSLDTTNLPRFPRRRRRSATCWVRHILVQLRAPNPRSSRSESPACPTSSNVRIPLAKSAEPLRHPPKRPQKGPASWIRTGLPGSVSREQTANMDFANGIRPADEVVQSKPGAVSARVRLTDSIPRANQDKRSCYARLVAASSSPLALRPDARSDAAMNHSSDMTLFAASPWWRPEHLRPFAMWTAFPSSDYYGRSVAMGLAAYRRSRVRAS